MCESNRKVGRQGWINLLENKMTINRWDRQERKGN